MPQKRTREEVRKLREETRKKTEEEKRKKDAIHVALAELFEIDPTKPGSKSLVAERLGGPDTDVTLHQYNQYRRSYAIGGHPTGAFIEALAGAGLAVVTRSDLSLEFTFDPRPDAPLYAPETSTTEGQGEDDSEFSLVRVTEDDELHEVDHGGESGLACSSCGEWLGGYHWKDCEQTEIPF